MASTKESYCIFMDHPIHYNALHRNSITYLLGAQVLQYAGAAGSHVFHTSSSLSATSGASGHCLQCRTVSVSCSFDEAPRMMQSLSEASKAECCGRDVSWFAHGATCPATYIADPPQAQLRRRDARLVAQLVQQLDGRKDLALEPDVAEGLRFARVGVEAGDAGGSTRLSLAPPHDAPTPWW